MAQIDMDQLRSELQADRLALQETITDGFNRIEDKFDEHARSDADNFKVVAERLASTETKLKTVIGIMGAIGTALLGVITALITGALGG